MSHSSAGCWHVVAALTSVGYVVSCVYQFSTRHRRARDEPRPAVGQWRYWTVRYQAPPSHSPRDAWACGMGYPPEPIARSNDSLHNQPLVLVGLMRGDG